MLLSLLRVVGSLAGSGWLVRQWRAGQAPITQALRPVRVRLAPVNAGALLTGTRGQREATEMSTDCLFQPMLTAVSISPTAFEAQDRGIGRARGAQDIEDMSDSL